MPLYFSPEIRYLLLNHFAEKDQVYYNLNSTPFQAPKIGPRPPYYTNPTYQQQYPLI
jgi:hypothetical protein